MQVRAISAADFRTDRGRNGGVPVCDFRTDRTNVRGASECLSSRERCRVSSYAKTSFCRVLAVNVGLGRQAEVVVCPTTTLSERCVRTFASENLVRVPRDNELTFVGVSREVSFQRTTRFDDECVAHLDGPTVDHGLFKPGYKWVDCCFVVRDFNLNQATYRTDVLLPISTGMLW